MPDTVPRTVPYAGADSPALRVVLFGMPEAGKTSLLAALLQASTQHTKLLDGQLTDISGKLTELQKQLRRQPAQPTTEEMVGYPVRFKPAHAGQARNGEL